MVQLAWRNLAQSRTQFILGVGGVALALLLMLALDALLAGSEDQKQRWLPAIAAGELVATVALPDGAGPFSAESATVSAASTGAGWSLSGRHGERASKRRSGRGR